MREEVTRRQAAQLAGLGILALSTQGCSVPKVDIDYVNTEPIEGLERRLGRHVSESGGSPFYRSSKIIEETARSTPGAIVGDSIGEILDNTLLSDDRRTATLVGTDIYTLQEIRQVAIKHGIAYIQSEHKGTALSASIQEKDKKKLEHHLRQEFPQREKQKKQEHDQKVLRAKQDKTNKYINLIKNNKSLYLVLEGQLSPFIRDGMGDFKHLSDELRQNKAALAEFFPSKSYVNLPAESGNEQNMGFVLGLLQKYATKDHEVFIMYQGHGLPEGMSMKGHRIISPKEMRLALEKISGQTTFAVNCCYSGDVRQDFEDNNSSVRVLSASKVGETVRASKYGKPGHLVQDIVKSGLDLSQFEEVFKSKSSADYHPAIYRP